jgi:hypothetical protein
MFRHFDKCFIKEGIIAETAGSRNWGNSVLNFYNVVIDDQSKILKMRIPN